MKYRIQVERNCISSDISSPPEKGLKTVRFFRSCVVSEVLIEIIGEVVPHKR